MQPLTTAQIRACFINVSQRERNGIIPPDLETTAWANLDYLGWRDAKIPALGYVVVEFDDGPKGILLRASDSKPRARAQCAWCEDVLLPNDVLIFSAKRAGRAGRVGNTTATLVCANFECSANVRARPPVTYVGFDPEQVRARRIANLQEHSRNFVRNVMGTP